MSEIESMEKYVPPAALEQHHWLRRLVGTWRSDGDQNCMAGTERGRMIGDYWVVCESEGTMPDGETFSTKMTLGYDRQRGKFVGSWVGSMMEFQWIYEGDLDLAANRLVLNSVGPAFDGSGAMQNYRDVITFLTDDHRTLTSFVQEADGTWKQFMEGHFHRV